MSPDASASCLRPTFDLLEPRILLSGFTAYNDTVAGPLTGEYTTLYADNGGAAAGQLRDVATGADTPVILTTIGVGVGFGGTGANPADGTPADVIFGGYIDFTSAWGSNAIEMSGSATYTYRFENLDPGSTYDFAGTAIRGSDSYTDRWTLVTLLGVDPDSFTTAHSSGDGIYTAGLAANQVALWTGANHLSSQGFVVQWLDIDPGADGEFEVVSQQYTGLIPTSVDPAGVADGNKGYGLNGVRLIENVPSTRPRSSRRRRRTSRRSPPSSAARSPAPAARPRTSGFTSATMTGGPSTTTGTAGSTWDRWTAPSPNWRAA